VRSAQEQEDFLNRGRFGDGVPSQIRTAFSRLVIIGFAFIALALLFMSTAVVFKIGRDDGGPGAGSKDRAVTQALSYRPTFRALPDLHPAPISDYTCFSCSLTPTTRFDFGFGIAPESGRVALA